jgi:hypothetical protein
MKPTTHCLKKEGEEEGKGEWKWKGEGELVHGTLYACMVVKLVGYDQIFWKMK